MLFLIVVDEKGAKSSSELFENSFQIYPMMQHSTPANSGNSQLCIGQRHGDDDDDNDDDGDDDDYKDQQTMGSLHRPKASEPVLEFKSLPINRALFLGKPQPTDSDGLFDLFPILEFIRQFKKSPQNLLFFYLQ